jgi:hypothetical protein
MSKLGIKISIDVTKIDKSRIFEGKKGKYLNLTTFIDVETPDEYDNNGFISQETTKEEREAGIQTPILGNCKVFYNSQAVAAHKQGVQNVQSAISEPPAIDNSFDDDLPW